MGATLNDVSSAAQQQWFSVLLSAGAWRAATACVRARALAHKGQMCCKMQLQVPSARSTRSRFRQVSEQMYRCLSRRSCGPCGLRAVFLLRGNGSGLLCRVFRVFEQGERRSARTAFTETTSQLNTSTAAWLSESSRGGALSMCAPTSRVHRLRPAKARDVAAHRARRLRCLS